MEHSTPKVSVIIPVFNAEEHLRECLDSIVNQSLKNIEIICVDDGSTDGSLKILREYENNDSRVRILTQSNQFAGVARNHGMEIASGEYYSFMDADDYFTPDALELLYSECERYKLDIVKAAFYNLEPNKEPYADAYSANTRLSANICNKLMSCEENLAELLYVADVPWNGMYRASFIKEHNLLFNNFRVVNDHSFYIACITCVRRFMVIDRYIAYHRVNQSSSLIGTKHKYYQCQIDSYYLGKKIVRDLPQQQQRLVMQTELKGVLGWYGGLRPSAPSPYGEKMDKELSDFVESFNINDVGSKHLFTMLFKEYFFKFRNELLSKADPQKYDSQSQGPLISVIIPVFNAGDHLRECLDSVLSQTLQEIEIICVDDGSTDDSQQILRSYETADNRIRILSQENSGPGPARNLGIGAAKGEYIAFMDADDYYPDSTVLQKLYSDAKGKNVYICGGSLCTIKNGKRNTSFASGRFWGYTFPVDTLALYSDYQFDFGFYRFIYNRQFLLDNKIFFPAYIRTEDPLFFVRAMIAAERFYAIHDLTYCYRESDHFNSAVENIHAVCDCILGYSDMLELAKANNLHELYCLIMQRVFIGSWRIIEAAINNQDPNADEALSRLTRAVDLTFWNPSTKHKDNLQVLQYARFLVLEKTSQSSTNLLNAQNTMKQKIDELQETEKKLKQEIDGYQKTEKELRQEIISLKSSLSFRIGRSITFIPRKIRGGVRCYREHGARYTWERLMIHLHLKRSAEEKVK